MRSSDILHCDSGKGEIFSVRKKSILLTIETVESYAFKSGGVKQKNRAQRGLLYVDAWKG